jgi:hypothetical protein
MNETKIECRMEEDSEKAKAFAVPVVVAQPIEKGSTVKYKDGYYRVTAKFRNTVNLGSIFGSTIYFRQVPISEVKEAGDEWFARWRESETYKSM